MSTWVWLICGWTLYGIEIEFGMPWPWQLQEGVLLTSLVMFIWVIGVNVKAIYRELKS